MYSPAVGERDVAARVVGDERGVAAGVGRFGEQRGVRADGLEGGSLGVAVQDAFESKDLKPAAFQLWVRGSQLALLS